MNKIIIVGHPNSGYERVESMLQHFGMSAALPALHEKLTAVEIDHTLCKAHGFFPVARNQSDLRGPVKQIDIAPVWHGLVMDLVRGNLDQPLWGWADPAAIHLLDFWANAIPDLMFVLVYNHPTNVLPELFSSDASNWDDDELVGKSTGSWRRYNEALLRFYHRNMDRCLLIHSECAANGDKSRLDEVKGLLGLSSDDLSTTSAVGQLTGDFNQSHEPSKSSESPDDALMSLEQTGAPEIAQQMPGDLLARQTSFSPNVISANPLMNLLADAMAKQSPADIELYEELQAVATLPGQGTSYFSKVDILKAWRGLGDLLRDKHQLMVQAKQLNSQLESLEKYREVTEHREEQAIKDYQLLMTQLFETQEHLEANLAEKQKYQSLAGNLEKSERIANTHLKQIRRQLNQVITRHRLRHPEGAAKRLQEDLPYVIGATMIRHARSVWKLLFLPITLWFVARRHREKSRQLALPPIAAYDDYEEAKEKIECHLSFKLGEAWLKHIHKPWNFILMPFALLGAYMGYRRNRKANVKLRGTD
ncbi:MAG: hypothetical protein JXX14_02575 [Deltaproteobacteria bacterium]|nr:hypothetical protein [Deltaproteobacteria bacterium]